MDLTRRNFVRSAAAIGTAAGLAPIVGRATAYAAEPVRWASLTPGFTVLVTEYIRYHKLDEKNAF
jgi:NitT/TauT family transport system substrate-binding protein